MTRLLLLKDDVIHYTNPKMSHINTHTAVRFRINRLYGMLHCCSYSRWHPSQLMTFNCHLVGAKHSFFHIYPPGTNAKTITNKR